MKSIEEERQQVLAEQKKREQKLRDEIQAETKKKAQLSENFQATDADKKHLATMKAQRAPIGKPRPNAPAGSKELKPLDIAQDHQLTYEREKTSVNEKVAARCAESQKQAQIKAPDAKKRMSVQATAKDQARVQQVAHVVAKPTVQHQPVQQRAPAPGR